MHFRCIMDKKILSKFILGCDLDNIQETVIIAPCWLPESVGLKDVNLISDSSSKIWNCKVHGQYLTYILTGVGACNCADTVMALGNTACKRIMFMGSAGAIDKRFCIGDIIFPHRFVVGEGATKYLQKNLKHDTFGNIYNINERTCEPLLNSIIEPAQALGVACHSGTVISVESIYSQFQFIADFIKMGCQFIDMESSAFVAATKKIGIQGIVCFCISDNVMKNQSLIAVSNQMTNFRKNIRKQLMPIIIQQYVQTPVRD